MLQIRAERRLNAGRWCPPLSLTKTPLGPYKISPGTMYPILHGLEKRGYLQSSEERSGKSLRRVYRITVSGRRALNKAKLRVRELFGELIEGK
jgi:DNA-binding PadR family transcriptional regulator